MACKFPVLVCSEAEPRDTGEKAARSWKMVRRSQSSLGIIASLEPGIESVKLKWNSEENSPVLVMHDGVTKSIFVPFYSSERS